MGGPKQVAHLSFFTSLSMDFITLLLIAVGVSMDAFAVSICKGLSMGRITFPKAAVVGLWFGGFQALMPLIGYFAGIHFSDAIEGVDHWVAFALLALIGINMIREATTPQEEECDDCGDERQAQGSPLCWRKMLPMAVATSIDALAVGISFAVLQVEIWGSVATIGVTTFLFSIVGVKVGGLFGTRYKSKAELAGGIILILIGLKILLKHLIGS